VGFDEKVKESQGYLAAVAKALGKLVDKKDFSKTEVCISISAKNANSQFITVDGELKGKALEKEIAEEAENQIPFPLEEVEWRYHLMGDGDEDELQVALFAARSEHIQKLLGVMDDAGLDVRGVQTPGMALYNLISEIYDEDLVVLDFGEKSTGLLVTCDEQFWMRSLPLSGSHITTLLERKFRLTNAEAKSLKNEMGNSSQREKLFRVIEPKLKELVIEIKRSINFRKTQMKDLDPKSFLALGGSSMLPGASDFFAQHLGYKMCEPSFGDLDFSNCEKSEGLKAEFPSYALAFGLAMQGLGLGKSKVNLAPVSHIKKQIIKEKKWSLLIANAALLLLAWVSAMANGSLQTDLQSGQDELKRTQRVINGEINKFKDHEGSIAPKVKELEQMERVMYGDTVVPRIYDQIESVLDRFDGVYVTSMSLSNLGPNSFSPSGLTKKRATPSGRGGSEANSATVVELKFVGNSAKENTTITNELTDLPIFKTVSGSKKPVITSVPKEFSWSFTPRVVIEGEDPFEDNAEVEKIRAEKGWVYSHQGERHDHKLAKNVQTLKLQVNLASLLESESEDVQ
jgi:type IV pilus assembly protein PilM